MSEDWNDVDEGKDESPIVSDDDLDEPVEVDLTTTPKEEPQTSSTEPVGAIVRNVPMTVRKEELKQYLPDFDYTIVNVKPKYDDNTIDYFIAINGHDQTITETIIKFNTTICGKNVTMDFCDLPRKGGRRREYRNNGNGRDYGGSRGNGRNRNYTRDNNQFRGNYNRNSPPKQRSNNSNDIHNLRNSSYNNHDRYQKSYQNKSSNSLSYSKIDRKYNSSNTPDINTLSPSTPSDTTLPKLSVLSVTPEKSKLENLPTKDFNDTEVRDQNIFGSGKARDEFAVSPIDLPSGSTTPNDRGYYQDITPSPIVPYPQPKNNNQKKNKQNKKQVDQHNQKNKNANKNNNKNQKSNSNKNRFGALYDDEEKGDDSSNDDNE